MENRELNQAAFDKVVRHLLRQKKRSWARGINGSGCKYRGPGGLMCAVGCLIPDSEYSPRLENILVGHIADRVGALAGLDTDMLQRLQFIHDRNKPSRWLPKLRSVARDFGLTMPDLEQQP